jgi:type II secretory pathway component PulF
VFPASSETVTAAPAAAADDLAVFHRVLAELCRSDVPLPKAFRLLQGDLRSGRFRTSVGEMADEVESGVPLGDAYARRKQSFPPLYCALVEAGMVSGDLPGVLEQISRHATLRAETAGRIRKALAYPMVTAFFVLVLGGFAFLTAGPGLTVLSTEVAADSTAPMVLAALGGLAAITLLTFVLVWMRSPFGVPVVGPLRSYAARSSFAATMALLLRRDIPLPTAFALAAEATDDSRVRARVEAMAEAARSGSGLAESVRSGKLLDSSLLWFVETAQSAGGAANALDDLAAVYRQRLDRAVDRLTVLITPLAELFVGIALLLCALGLVGPLMSLTNRIF